MVWYCTLSHPNYAIASQKINKTQPSCVLESTSGPRASPAHVAPNDVVKRITIVMDYRTLHMPIEKDTHKYQIPRS